MQLVRSIVGLAVSVVVVVAVAASATSPLLEWRQPIYIVAGLAGVLAMVLLLAQPLLIAGLFPGLSRIRSRAIHRWVGVGLLSLVVIHVLALWITSPPDVIDALLFASPTPFSIWGVIAMWAVFISTGLVTCRHKLKWPVRRWRSGHRMLAAIIVIGSVLHAMLIEGTMELMSKSLLCLLVIVATVLALFGSKLKF